MSSVSKMCTDRADAHIMLAARCNSRGAIWHKDMGHAYQNLSLRAHQDEDGALQRMIKMDGCALTSFALGVPLEQCVSISYTD